MNLILLGDSHSVRYNNFIGNQQLQLSVSNLAKGGATIEDCRKALQNNTSQFKQLGKIVFLSVGSNNILKGQYDPTESHKQFKALLQLIQRKIKPDCIFIMKIPLFYRHKNNLAILSKVHAFNSYLASFCSDKVRTLNIPGVTDVVSNHSFQPVFRNGRQDLIHLSDLGYATLHGVFTKHLLSIA